MSKAALEGREGGGGGLLVVIGVRRADDLRQGLRSGPRSGHGPLKQEGAGGKRGFGGVGVAVGELEHLPFRSIGIGRRAGERKLYASERSRCRGHDSVGIAQARAADWPPVPALWKRPVKGKIAAFLHPNVSPIFAKPPRMS
jgi:hypothetical protein